VVAFDASEANISGSSTLIDGLGTRHDTEPAQHDRRPMTADRGRGDYRKPKLRSSIDKYRRAVASASNLTFEPTGRLRSTTDSELPARL
jgi:hypothetical protein